MMMTLFFCLATSAADRAVADAATSPIMSTFWVSNHSRALVPAKSALFWWSA